MRLVPQHDGLGLALADGLARCGRFDDARAQLLHLVEQAGWRKTRKRGVLHQRLAGIARAQGDTALALVELEQASSMDASSPEILTQLGEVAEAAGDLDKAERAYRTLLMQARDGARSEQDAAGAGLALTEILLRLHGLARKRGHAGEADELLDSALAAAIKDPEQALRLQRGLLQAGAHDELARLFEKRLAHAAGTPAEAEVSAEMADCLREQGRHEAAFDAQLRAVEAAPEIAHRHRPLVELARTTGRLEQLVERLLALVERRRRKADMGVASTLLLLAADIAEHDFGDRKRALDLHRRAEEMQPQSLGVLSGIARLAREQGDVAECDRVAGLLKLAAAEARNAQAAADALYLAAELELARPEMPRRRHRHPVRSAGQEPRRRARREAGRGRGRAGRRAGEDPAALRAHRPAVGRRVRAARLPRAARGRRRRHAGRGARGDRPGRRPPPRRPQRAAADAARRPRGRPRRRTRRRDVGAAGAAAHQEGRRRPRGGGADSRARGDGAAARARDAAGPRSRRARRSLGQPPPGGGAAGAPAPERARGRIRVAAAGRALRQPERSRRPRASGGRDAAAAARRRTAQSAARRARPLAPGPRR